MKVITESFLRERFRKEIPETFTVEGGQILTPAAAQLLSERRVRVTQGTGADASAASEAAGQATAAADQGQAQPEQHFLLAGGGGYFVHKPAHLTRLRERSLAPKDHPRIVFRGALDSLHAELLLVQRAAFEGGRKKMLAELQELLDAVLLLQQREVTGEALPDVRFMGMDAATLAEHCHEPRAHVGTDWPSLRYDSEPLLLQLNALRCRVREVECQAVRAFRTEFEMQREDVMVALNAMSDVVTLLVLKEYAGKYR